jgi:glycosyltransferase involved in cell wall biosynthesis
MLGIPCVTTDVGSAREVVVDGSTGRVVGVNSRDVADALLELLGDHGRLTNFGAAARRHAEGNFSSARLVADYSAIYRQLVPS